MIIRTFLLLSFFNLFLYSAHAAPGKPYSDQWIEGRVRGALDFNTYFDSSDIDVEVSRGLVVLKGTVPTESEREFAYAVASNMEGVTAVTNQIKVDESVAPRSRSELSQFIADLTTSAAVKSRLLANKGINGSSIEVTTKNGRTVLAGTVNNSDEKKLAERIASSTRGVQDISNELKVEHPSSIGEKVGNKMVDISSSVSDAWISTKVRSLLAFSTDFAGSHISVTTSKGKVTLKGTVRNEQQKVQIATEVNEIVGVREIQNELIARNV